MDFYKKYRRNKINCSKMYIPPTYGLKSVSCLFLTLGRLLDQLKVDYGSH